jgi:two-component system, NarL family, response regulator DevR
VEGNTRDDAHRIRVLLVEDHPIVLLGLRTVVTAQPDMELVGEAGTATEVMALTNELHPDLVVLPLRLEGELKGVELCREIKSAVRTRVLIYTSYNSGEDAAACLLSGADSFVYKGEDSGRLLDTMRATAAGRRVWLLGGEHTDQSDRMRQLVASSGLTRREQEVLGFMLQRFTNGQIANELFVELPTVKTHVSSILRKLGLRSRQELF